MNKHIETQLKARACEYVMSEHPFFEAPTEATDSAWAEWYDKAISNRVDFSACTPAGDYVYRATDEFEYYEIATALEFVYNIMRFAVEGLNDE